MSFQIAIDGPAGAGKSTIAKLASEKLSAVYVDTGAMYRTIALYLLRRGTDLDDEAALCAALGELNIEMRYEKGIQQMLLNGENVTDQIRTEEVSMMASRSSARGPVRRRLLTMQRELAEKEDVLMDGRDIGTTILPDAQLKIYLTASVEARAKRRFYEMTAKGMSCTLEEIEADIALRDKQDMERKESPLRQAEDAVYLDSSDMTIEEVVDRVVQLAKERRTQA